MPIQKFLFYVFKETQLKLITKSGKIIFTPLYKLDDNKEKFHIDDKIQVIIDDSDKIIHGEMMLLIYSNHKAPDASKLMSKIEAEYGVDPLSFSLEIILKNFQKECDLIVNSNLYKTDIDSDHKSTKYISNKQYKKSRKPLPKEILMLITDYLSDSKREFIKFSIENKYSFSNNVSDTIGNLETLEINYPLLMNKNAYVTYK
ncbi:MAG: hypothetical protein HRT87_02595 [Legionellales bacterium]|nr:hypothetical protein [Legionellales bacterium]